MTTFFSWASAVPASASAPTAPSASAQPRIVARPIVSSLVERCLVAERPDPEVVADVAPQAVQAFRFGDQKQDDQAAEHHQTHVRNDVQQLGIGKNEAAECFETPARYDRQQSHEDRAEKRTEHPA